MTIVIDNLSRGSTYIGILDSYLICKLLFYGIVLGDLRRLPFSSAASQFIAVVLTDVVFSSLNFFFDYMFVGRQGVLVAT